ncbi:anthranilate synthase component I [bacterium]|jgi:anthranilate synthase component I|nr:anthranilate synthase component I [bacterium]
MKTTIPTFKLKPVFKEMLGDLETPVSLYMKLGGVNSFLLESVTGGENIARYSFVGLDPFCTFQAKGESISVDISGNSYNYEDNPIDALENLMSRFEIEHVEGLPKFVGGAVGFFPWEIIEDIEPVSLKGTNKDTVKGQFMFPRVMIIFDHVKRRIILLVWSIDGDESGARKRLDEIETLIKKPLTEYHVDIDSQSVKDPYSKTNSNYKKEDFLKHVDKVKDHIYEGDVFQLVLSQKFSIDSKKKPFEVYRKLRSVNPSPYMFYFQFEKQIIIGTSPEILVRLEDDHATLRPIAGTRPRIIGKEDEMIESLLNDEKECAEHIMLVDLGRNDLGRVCKYNSVKTTSIKEIEKYSHVLHMVSNVEGKIDDSKNAFDLFKATFPCGTVSGAPKIRAIEIIDKLEPEKRGIYSGAIGYFDFRGNMDFCIAIRTIIYENDKYYVQAGAGVVADSVPENEFQETRNKAKGMVMACL